MPPSGGFDLDATVRVLAGARDHLERVCRYALRPPIAQDRVRLPAEGDVLLELRHRWSDGTTHLRFHPLERLERLASLTPRPRISLVLYYGVLAAHAGWRARLPRPGDAVATAAQGLGAAPAESSAAAMEPVLPDGADAAPMSGSARPVRPGSNGLWAPLMQRTFGFDGRACPRCGGRFRLIALIEHAGAVRRIPRHLGLPAEVPPPRPRARRPETGGAHRRVGFRGPLIVGARARSRRVGPGVRATGKHPSPGLRATFAQVEFFTDKDPEAVIRTVGGAIISAVPGRLVVPGSSASHNEDSVNEDGLHPSYRPHTVVQLRILSASQRVNVTCVTPLGEETASTA